MTAEEARVGTCPVCGADELRPVVEIDDLPVFCNVLWPSRAEAVGAPKGDLRLVHCPGCTHFFNGAFDPTLTEYDAGYENSLHFSDRFNRYARELAERLVETYDLRGRDIVEVGCGRGDFLRLLCGLGGSRGVGFDRSHGLEPGAREADGGDVRLVTDFLTPEQPRIPVDFLCCRHVLEHVAEPVEFLRDIRSWLGEDGNPAVYFEVPNALATVERGGIWDLIYEHFSYFTPDSLVSLFRRAGFAPHSWGEAFGGQYLFIEARPSSDALDASVEEGGAREPLESVARFRAELEERVRSWRKRVADAARDGVGIALWGGGSKGVTFLNLVDPGPVVCAVVDVNPHKQGRYVAGSGHRIVSPDALAEASPEMVVVTNELYLAEIEAALDGMGVRATTELA